MPGRWFLTGDIPLQLCIAYRHSPWLVAVSYLIAAFASYTAFDLVARVRAAGGYRARFLWLLTAGLSMGFGIWAMHFIAMLAVEIPIPIRFDLPLTVLSAGFAVLASAIAFHQVAAETPTRLRICLAGVALGVGIGLMHYTGMAALRLPAHIYYDPWLFGLSIAVAVLLSMAALFALAARPRLRDRRLLVVRLAGAAVMGLAIALMHYTGIYAANFYPVPGLHEEGVSFDPPIMAAAIAAVSLLIVGLALIAALFDRRVKSIEAMLRDAVESFSDGFVIFDPDDRFVMCNQAYRRIYAESAGLLAPGTSFEAIMWLELREGKYPDAHGHEAEWLAEHLHQRREGAGPFERQLSDGSWILAADRRMSNGGTAGLRVDVTALKSAEAALKDSEQRLDRAQEIAGIGSWEFDVTTGRRAWSKELYRIRGLLKDENAPTIDGLADYTHPDDCRRFYAWLDALKQGQPQEPIEYRILRPDGAERIVRAEARPMTDANGIVSKVAGTLQDVTERRRIEQQLDAALNNLIQGVCFFDGSRRLILANRRYAEIYNLPAEVIRPGITLKELVDRRVAVGSAPRMTREDYLAWRAAVAVSRQPNDTIVQLANGQIISIHHRPMPDGGWVSTHEDITERRQAEERLAHMARHDVLTGLPNRALLREYVDQEARRHTRRDSMAMLCLDLDRFKYVNDTFGHAAGDVLLCTVAEKLSENIREEDIAVRLGGDEFAIVQISVDQPSEASALAVRLINILSQPFGVAGHQIAIGVSVGIAYSPTCEADPETLLKNADMALYRAKANGRGTFCFFDPIMNAQAQARHALETGLRAALANGEFELHFQPILNAHTEALNRFEALIRWRHPQRGLLPPAKFVPFAEETGLIIPIGEWVLQAACRIAATWPEHISVAVNLSALQLSSPNFVATVRDALCISGLPPSRLELEITETVLLQNTSAVLEPLHLLKADGLHIALDDFGMGHSSISCLRIFPFDRIKIDQSFVSELGAGTNAVAVVHAIVDLGAAFGMVVTAEGVDSEDQLRTLRAESCAEVQGNLFSAPVPAAEVLSMIAWKSSATPVGP